MMKSTVLFAITLVLMALLIPTVEVIAQSPPPPVLPGMPDQAPLGGLGLLAAAGGAYAWRKLRMRSDR